MNVTDRKRLGTLSWVVYLCCSLQAGAVEAEVSIQQQANGGVVVTTSAYSVVIARDGCLQSVKAGDSEFLGTYEKFGASSAILDYIPPGNFGVFREEMTRIPLGKACSTGSPRPATKSRRSLVFRRERSNSSVTLGTATAAIVGASARPSARRRLVSSRARSRS